MAIPLKVVALALRKYSDIQSDLPGVHITVEPESYWSAGSLSWRFIPNYSDIQSIGDIARICEITNWYLPQRAWDSTNHGNLSSIVTGSLNAMYLTADHTKTPQSPVKYFFDLEASRRQGFSPVFPVFITDTPTEHNIDGRTVRLIIGHAPGCYGESAVRDCLMAQRMSFVVSTDHALYNYLDKGHILFFAATPSGPEIFVANQVSLAVYHFAAIFSVVPDKAKTLLRNNVLLFSQNQAELQRVVQAAERMLPEKLRAGYLKLKQAIREDFEKNAQNVLVTKFQRGEAPVITLNNIKFNPNKVTYETITLEGEGIAEAILSRVDSNSVFDIYQLIENHISSVVVEMESAPRNANSQGFAEARTWNFSINGMPIAMSLSTTNTRRRVNGHLINNDELVRVVRRASCYTDAVMYNKFLRQVELASLRVHDALANGVPIKIMAFDRHNDYNRQVTNKHPKIFFVCEKGKYYLWLNKAKTEKVPLRRFVGLLDAIKRVNIKTDGHYTHEGNGRRDTVWCRTKLREALNAHAVDDKAAPLITDTQLTTLIEWLLEARTEAERKSKELLDSVIKETESKQVEYKGITAFEVTGNSGRVYAVEKESFKVWDSKTGDYVCIVDGRGEMGVGYDALVLPCIWYVIASWKRAGA